MYGITFFIVIVLVIICYCLCIKVQNLEMQVEDLNFEAHSINEQIYDLENKDE